MAHTCPVCLKDDAVAKVSAIVAAHTTNANKTSANFSPSLGDGGITLLPKFEDTNTSTRTELAKTLSFPENGISIWGRFGGLVLVLIGVAFPLFILISVFSEPVGSPDRSATYPIVLTVVIGLFFTALGLGLLLGGTSMEEQRHARETWLELYYCFRNDIVYDPRTPDKYRSRLEMKQLIEGSSTRR